MSNKRKLIGFDWAIKRLLRNKAMPYSKIRKIISVSLVYFDLGVGEDYAYHGQTRFIGINKKDEDGRR